MPKIKYLILLTSFCFAYGFSANAQNLPKRPNGPIAPSSIVKDKPILNPPTIGELSNVLKLYRVGNYVKALTDAKALADRGDNNAAALAGFMYENGLGTEKSLINAADYYRKGPKSDDALIGLGRIALISDIVPANEGKSALEAAIKLKRNDAKKLLADLLISGKTTIDKAVAYKLYSESAINGDNEAAYSAAILLDDGEDNPKDNPKEALRLLSIVANAGIPAAMADYGLLIYQGRGTPKNLVKAAEWFKKSAESGDLDGAFYWSLVNAKGEGVTQNIPLAWQYIQIAKDNDESSQRLYNILLNVPENIRNPKPAIKK